MSPLQELIVASRRSLRYGLGVMLFLAGGLILVGKLLNGAPGWF